MSGSAFFSGVRARLTLLVLLAVLPAVGLTLYLSHHSGKFAARHTLDDAMRLVQLASMDYGRLVESTRHLLGALAQLPAVRKRHTGACSALLTDLKTGYPHYANLGAIRTDGRVFCSATPMKHAVNAADRDYFRRAVETRGFAAGDYQIGRITGKPVVVFAHPAHDPAGRLQAVVFAAFDLTWLNRLAAGVQLPAGTTLTILDGQGTVLNRWPDPEKWIGKSMADLPLKRAILTSQEAGTLEAAGLDGVSRLYAFAPLFATSPDRRAWITVGIPHEIAFAEINLILTRTLAGLAMVTALVLAAAWFGGDYFLLKKIHVLADTARRLARGERARTGIADARGEIGLLAHTFDDMANAIEARTDEIQRANDALSESDVKLRTVSESARDAILMIDDRGKITFWNRAAEAMFGYRREETLGKDMAELIVPARLREMHNQGLKAFQRTGQGAAIGKLLELPARRRDGSEFIAEHSISAVKLEGKWHAVGIVRDITERRQAEAAYHQDHELLEKIFSTTHILCAYLDTDFNFVRVNRAYAEADGRSPEFFVGKNRFALYPDAEAEAIFRRVVQTGEPYTVHARPFTYPDHPERGVTFWDWSLQPVRDPGGKISGLVLSLANVTDRIRAQEQVQYLAHHDDLTGLPNRALLLDRVKQAVIEARRHGRQVAVICLDIDRFKFVNEAHGYVTGDAVLKAAAERLAACVRPGDTVARLGGDEFAVALSDVAHVDDIGRIVQKIMRCADALPAAGDNRLFVTLSVGITLFPLDGNDPETLLKNAAVAMHQAKQQGGNSYQYYSAQMTAEAAEHLALENSLRLALERREFVLHYQPQVSLYTGAVTGVEALIRWRHPEKGLISPAKFIPLAEETGIIVPIGDWVLATACAQMRTWREAGLPPLRVAVNLSAQHFKQPGLDETVRRILRETGADPHRLDIELTESTLAQNPEAISSVLNNLERLGVQISIDDFGTGYSSLSYLKRFPVDVLKIDQSFVRDITTDPNDAAIVIAIIGMAHALGVQTIAEGVETREQLEFLRQHHCDAMQGYYFSKPLPAEDIAALLRENRGLAARG